MTSYLAKVELEQKCWEVLLTNLMQQNFEGTRTSSLTNLVTNCAIRRSCFAMYRTSCAMYLAVYGTLCQVADVTRCQVADVTCHVADATNRCVANRWNVSDVAQQLKCFCNLKQKKLKKVKSLSCRFE